MEFDKTKTCKDCPDRSIHPNCHTICEGYIKRTQQKIELNRRIREDKSIFAFDRDMSKKRKKRRY